MTISKRTKAAALVTGVLCVAGPATVSLANGIGGDDKGDGAYVERRIPGPAGSSDDTSSLRTMAGLSWRSCGVTASDRSVAKKISPRIYSPKLHGVTAEQVACARLIVKATKSKGLNSRAGQIALMTSQVESQLYNVNGGDKDSLGLFQQRPSQGWGTRSQVLNPNYATKKFLSVMLELHRNGSWKTKPMGDVAQAVQRSGHPDRYAKEQGAAKVIVDALWGGGGGSGPTNPYNAAKICGPGYKVIDSQALGKAGRAYLLYNNSNGKNCVTTLKATSLGKKTAVSAFLEVRGKARTTDAGTFSYYAGPVRKAAPNACVKWGGSVGTAKYTSPFEHCG